MQTEWVQRYIYAVTKELPDMQRADIEKELNGLIEDMLEERVQGREATREDVEAVLVELGNPQELADKYRDRKRYLIGPERFPIYISVLKIVLMAIGIAMVVLFIIQTVRQPELVLDHFVNSLGSFLDAGFQGFAWVTIGFGLSEYYGLRNKDGDLTAGKEWKVSDLPEIPDARNKISRSDPIVGIIFTVLGAALIVFSFDLIGVWVGRPLVVVPLFSETVFRPYLPFILGTLLLDVVFEMGKLVSGKWTLKLVAFEFLRNVVNLVVGLSVFVNVHIWNPDFLTQLTQAGLLKTSSRGLDVVSTIWTAFTENLVFLIGLVFILQTISTVVKLVRLRPSPGL